MTIDSKPLRPLPSQPHEPGLKAICLLQLGVGFVLLWASLHADSQLHHAVVAIPALMGIGLTFTGIAGWPGAAGFFGRKKSRRASA